MTYEEIDYRVQAGVATITLDRPEKLNALTAQIAANTSAVSVALTRQLMWRMLGAAHPMEAHRADSRAINATGRSADALEGVTSFLEKRPPTFTGTVTEDLPDVFPEWEQPEFR